MEVVYGTFLSETMPNRMKRLCPGRFLMEANRPGRLPPVAGMKPIAGDAEGLRMQETGCFRTGFGVQ